jgi:hypothetical protein
MGVEQIIEPLFIFLHKKNINSNKISICLFKYFEWNIILKFIMLDKFMSINTSIEKTCSCKKERKQNDKTIKSSYVLSFLIAILPKCPFCAFGYSAVITMCSGNDIHTYTPSAFHLLPIALASLLILSLVWNFKGRMTYYALSVALFGTAIIAYTEIMTGNATLYYIGVVFLFLSVLINGRFGAILHRFKYSSQP